MQVWIGYGLSGIATAFLSLDTVMKLVRAPAAMQATIDLGYAAATVRWIGLVELLCLALYVIAPTAPLGAILLTG